MQTPQILQQLGARALSPQMQAMMPQMQSLKQAMNAISNPNEFVKQALANNPQVNQLINMANGDPQKAFYDLCAKKGVNPQEFINVMTQM